MNDFSDIDTFAVIHDLETRWNRAHWQTDFEREIQQQYPFVKEVEIMLTQYFEDFYQKNPRLAMIIKTQSLCIYGEDLATQIPPFLPNKKMILNLTWLKEDLQDFLAKEKITHQACQEITKVLIRCGFEIVMEKAQKYTTDLYWCYQVFSEYFPEKEPEMRELLQLYLNPSNDEISVKRSVEKLGKWLLNQV